MGTKDGTQNSQHYHLTKYPTKYPAEADASQQGEFEADQQILWNDAMQSIHTTLLSVSL